MTDTRQILCLGLFAMSLTASLTACAAGQPLEAAQPGHGAVYLVRALQEPGKLELTVDGQPVATLPASAHTVVQLRAGPHRLGMATTGGTTDARWECTLDVQAGQRSFVSLAFPAHARAQIGVDLSRRITTAADGSNLPTPLRAAPETAASASAAASGPRPCQVIAEAEAPTALSMSAQRVAPAKAAY